MTIKTIEFEPQEPSTPKRRANPNSRTAKLTSMLLRPEGATSKQLTEAINRTKGQHLTERQVVTQWVVKSYLAPRGIGVVSEVSDQGGRQTLRMYGYRYGEKKPKVKAPKKEADRGHKEAA